MIQPPMVSTLPTLSHMLAVLLLPSLFQRKEGRKKQPYKSTTPAKKARLNSENTIIVGDGKKYALVG